VQDDCIAVSLGLPQLKILWQGELESHIEVTVIYRRDKARMELVIPHIRDSFWSGRSFASLEGINEQVIEWCLKIAEMKQHQMTNQEPFKPFRLDEQNQLKPLPAVSFEIVTWR
jgi:hypothetical protein